MIKIENKNHIDSLPKLLTISMDKLKRVSKINTAKPGNNLVYSLD